MNVDPEMVFEMWACFHGEVYYDDMKKAYYDWQKRGKLSQSVTDFCIDIMTDRIPLIAVPLKAKNKLKGNDT